MEEEECQGGVHQQHSSSNEVTNEQQPEIDKLPLPLPENNEQEEQLLQPPETEIAPDENFKPSSSPPLSEIEIDPVHKEEKLAGNNDEQVGDSKEFGDLDENNGGVINDKEGDEATDNDAGAHVDEDQPQTQYVPPVETEEAPVATADSSLLTEDVPINEPLVATVVHVPHSGPSMLTVDVPANAPPAEAQPAPSVVTPLHIVDELASPQMVTKNANSDDDSVPKVDAHDQDSAPEVDASTGNASPMIQDDDSSPKVDASTDNASPMIQDDDSSQMVDDGTMPGVSGNAHLKAEAPEADAEMEAETELVETPTSGGKRKRGRPAKIQTKAVQAKAPPTKKIEEEDVCFICFDGGNLVLCDRRGCPKAYHPACVNRDEAFFRSKGRWNCGWHICSNCEKGAQYMCYTCTYSLCKGCIKETEFFCVRGNKGFCETCMRTVMLIEKNEQAQVNFDDKSSWEFLFKEYWVDLKGKLALTPDELTQAKNPMKGSNTLARKGESSEELYDAKDDKGSDSDGSSEHLEVSSSKKKKARGRPRSSKEGLLPSATHALAGGTSLSNDADWASKDLLEFVAHMKNGDKSVLTQYDVQALLLEYIKQNNLRDPRKKSQIVCDSRLENLFGKSRVAHFEMLKLLESHFLIKEENHADDILRATAEVEANQLDGDGGNGAFTKVPSDKRRKSRKKGDGRGPQANLDDYAAIDVHNIKLLYLRRNLMEDLLEDNDKFHDKVVGSFVRIRISGSGAKQDMYRLVQVAGTRKAAEPYKTGKRTADVVLEIQNLNKTEVISIDTISNQEFSEDECKRLRQSIKFGLISRMTVGEVQDKAMSLQAVRVNDWLEMEKLRISHLRDRASEQGRRKDLRECVEKLELLNTPEERFRRLEEIPEVHADPNMDPNYESEEDEDEDDKAQDKGTLSRDAGYSRKGRDPISPGKGSPRLVDTWSGARKSVTTNLESGRNASVTGVWDRGYGANGAGESATSDGRHMNSWENPKSQASATSLVTGASSGHAVGQYGPSPGNSQEAAAPLPTSTASNISETEKMWHYKDPSGKIQGPFSMVQLRKWSTTGHFPSDLRIWRTTERPEDSILLNDALAGKYTGEVPQKGNGLSLPEKAEALSGNNREVNRVSSWEGNTTAAWTDKHQIDRSVNSSGWEGNTNVAWTEQTQMDRANTAWTGRNINDRAPNSNWNENSSFANGTTQLANSEAWGSGSSNWAAPTMDPKSEQSFRGGWNLRGNHGWSGRPIHSSSQYPGQPQRPAFHQGGQRGGRWNRDQGRGNNWNQNRYRGQESNNWRGYDKRANNMGASGPTWGENWRAPQDNSVKSWSTGGTEGWNINQMNRSNMSNLPSPTPNTSELNWTNQASANPWSPTPATSGVQVSPAASGWTEVSATPSGGWGSAPKPGETLGRDGRGDFVNPPSPTPPISASNDVNP